jgi:methylaspartate mutase epsilon subunit
MATERGHSILLGGVGGDSHSVGLTILRQALLGAGYRVHFLGTQNPVEDIVKLAPLFNVVMISSMDGHTRHYLRTFTELVQKYQVSGPLWYLGGNLTIGDSLGFERYFRDMGFDRVFVKFADLRQVQEVLAADLHGREPMAGAPALLGGPATPAALVPSAVVNDDRMDPVEFETARREVLEQWKTGRAARSLEENAEFLGRQASFPTLQRLRNERLHPMLIQPRCGVSGTARQLRLFGAFKAAGVPVLSYQVDSLTRNNNYTGVEEAMREMRETGVETMNGFPVVNHGVAALRRMAGALRVPLQVRHSTRDPRLLAEIAYAGGVTSFEGGPICYNIPYYKDYPLAESLRSWQYVDALTGQYHDRFGIVLDREYFGTLTATLIPPCLAIAVGILQALLAARQGVRCVSLGYAEVGNRAQDVAAIRMLGTLAAESLANLGHTGVQVNTVFHQYMAAFPGDPQRAEELIFNSAVTAGLSGATRVMIKTPVEAYRIPSMEDNLRAVELVRRGIGKADETPLDEAAVERESALIRREVMAILEGVVHAGRGSLTAGIVAAFREGLLDIPFSPSIHNRGEVMTARDTDGAVRFLSIGRLPLCREAREFHRDRMGERRRLAGIVTEAQKSLLVEHDVLQIARGEYAGWPLSA